MNVLLRTLLVILTAGTLLSGAACSSDEAPLTGTTFPTNVEELLRSDIGIMLSEYGYTPVAVLHDKDKNPIGHLYVFCGNEADLRKCSSNYLNMGTMERPSLSVNLEGRVTQLTSPYDGEDNYELKDIPLEYQNFTSLTPDEQNALLNVMPEAIEAYKAKGSDQGLLETPGEWVNTSIGTVLVVQRYSAF